MEAGRNNYIFSAIVPSLLMAVIFLLVAILYNVHRTRMKFEKVDSNAQQKEKEPEEHDERFATGEYACTLLR